MSFEFRLPDIGEGIAEGEITQWHVEPGQAVQEDDPFVEVMTDKATVEITAPKTGTIVELKVPAGQACPVGSVIAVIDTGASAGGGGQAEQPAATPDTPDTPDTPEPAAAAPASPAPASQAPAPAAAAPASKGTTNGSPGGRVLAAPAVRRRAREAGVSLHDVPASGKAGRVTKTDLESFLAQPAAASPEPAAAPASAGAEAPAAAPRPRAAVEPGSEERIPLRGIRKRISERMSQSKNTAAHFTYVDEVDVTALVEMRTELKATAADQGVKLTYMPFIVQAVLQALRKFPMLNSSLDEQAGEIVVKHYFNIGFAADTEAGLMVPVIHGADRLSLLGLGAAISDLAGRARDGKLSVDEVSGSTFTITNAGNIGGILATPVINFPEVAILGVHKIAEQAVVRDGEIVIRKMMNLSISLDHRLIDGAVGARFMNEVIRLLEDPRLLLLGSI